MSLQSDNLPHSPVANAYPFGQAVMVRAAEAVNGHSDRKPRSRPPSSPVRAGRFHDFAEHLPRMPLHRS